MCTHRLFLAAATLAFAFIPAVSRADTISDLQAQLQSLLAQVKTVQQELLDAQSAASASGTSTPSVVASSTPSQNHPRLHPPLCIELSHTLSVGATDATTGGEVSELQKTLAQDSSIYPEGLVTGYFGPATQRAIARFQQLQNIGASAAGRGVVDAATREIFRTCPQLPGSGSNSGSGSSSASGGSTGSSSNSGSTASLSAAPSLGLPSISINTSSLTSSSGTPILSGSAQNVFFVTVSLRDASNTLVYQSGLIGVTNGLWSVTVSSLPAGTYSVVAASISGNALATATLFIRSTASSPTNTAVSDTQTSSTNNASSPTPLPAAPTPSVTMRANGSSAGATVASGGTAVIGWNAPHADSCTISSSPASALSGSVSTTGYGNSTGPLTQTTVFTLVCTGAGGTATGSVTVNVAAGTNTASVSLPKNSIQPIFPGPNYSI